MRLGRRQQGLTTVEFAIVATTFFMILFGVIEVSRGLFVWNTIGEATRRGARVAVVCPPNHSAPARAAVFSNNPGGGSSSPVLSGLTMDNIAVAYLDADGEPTAVVADIRYVRVSITDYEHQFLIPLLTQTITVPPFSTTLPRESLGKNPDGPPECFGSGA
jgi:hypothetical protein